jgi:hypothetical protein
VDVIQACLFRCIWKQETLIFLVKVKNKDIISLKLHLRLNKMVDNNTPSGADPGFQVRGGAHRKIAPSWGRRENCWGISCEKSRFYAKKSYFFQFWGGGRRVSPPPLIRPWHLNSLNTYRIDMTRWFILCLFHKWKSIYFRSEMRY